MIIDCTITVTEANMSQLHELENVKWLDFDTRSVLDPKFTNPAEVELMATCLEYGTCGHEDKPTIVTSNRKINGKYTIPDNAFQISANTFVIKRPENAKWGVSDDKVKKSRMHAWHPSYGLSRGVCK